MCGLWSGMAHWSSAGRLPSGGRPGAPAGAARMAQVRALGALCAHGGITARDWMLTSWILEDRSGGTLIVDSLPEVWAGVERLSGRPLDPLDEAFLDRIEAAGGGLP